MNKQNMVSLVIDLRIARNKLLPSNAKIFYFSLIESSSDDGLIMIKEDNYPMLKKNQITRYLKQIQNAGLIKKSSRSKIKEIVQQAEVGRGIGSQQCEWCGTKCYAMHKHHYPKRKSEGGTETVKICPNCHTNFHYLEGITFEFTDFDYFIYAKQFIKASGEHYGY